MMNSAKIASILAGDFAIATPAEKGIVWKITLSVADGFSQCDPSFDRSAFYTAVFGNSDHFTVRDAIYLRPAIHGPTRYPEN
jgi:hypothetical protein